LSAMLDDGLNPQEALDRPRFCLEEGTGDSILALEEGIPTATITRLAELGHRIHKVSGVDRGMFGRGQIINREGNAFWGGSDPRGDGLVASF